MNGKKRPVLSKMAVTFKPSRKEQKAAQRAHYHAIFRRAAGHRGLPAF